MTRKKKNTDPGLLLFVSGPSGVGKSTICRQLATVLPAQFAVSATTRQGKPQDKFGKKYIFVNEKNFQKRIARKEFLEYANVFGYWYGTLKAPVLKALEAGKIVLLEIDVQGGLQVFKLFPHAVGIFILPPNPAELMRRLESRGRDEPDVIEKRIAEARREIKTAKASGAYRLMVVNDALVPTIHLLTGFVQGYQQGRLDVMRQVGRGGKAGFRKR